MLFFTSPINFTSLKCVKVSGSTLEPILLPPEIVGVAARRGGPAPPEKHQVMMLDQ